MTTGPDQVTCSIILVVSGKTGNEITLASLNYTSRSPVGMISVCGLVGCMSKIAFFLILRPCVDLQASAKQLFKLKPCLVRLSQLTSFGLSTVAWYSCILLWRHSQIILEHMMCMRSSGTHRVGQVISEFFFCEL